MVGECLTDRAEQDEVFALFDKIRRETGWRIDFIYEDLRKKWGHNDQEALALNQPYAPSTSLPPAPPLKLPPVGIINPVFAKADFTQQDHPYQQYYVPPATPLPHPGHQAFGY